MPNNKIDGEYAVLCGDFSVSPTKLRLTSASNALSTALSTGFYRMTSDTACYISMAAGAHEASTTNAIYLPADVVEIVPCDGTKTNVAAVSSGGDGYLCITKVG